MWITRVCLLCLVVVVMINGDTILYTNSPRHLVTSDNYTSYKLAVPGADPITIIEASQGPAGDKKHPSPGSLNDMRRQNWIRDEEVLLKRQNSKVGAFNGKSRNNEDPESLKSRTTVYSPDLLKKFLEDYAAKIKNSDSETKEKLEEILLFDDDDEDNYPLNSRPGESSSSPSSSEPEEKYGQDWNRRNKFDDRRHDRPNSGWVTMDVIPWSSSKVSKWQGHVQRLPNRPAGGDYHNRPDYPSSGEFDDRFQSNYRPNRPSYNDFDEVDRFSSSSFSDSHHHHHQRPHDNKFTSNKNYYNEIKPYYDYQTSSSSSSFDRYPGEEPNKKKDKFRPWRGDIVTDNRPPDFPEFNDQISSSSSNFASSGYYNKHRRPGGSSSSYENYSGENSRPYSNPYHSHKNSRPTSPPESGNGDWILVSTTKGYHFPRNGQRAIAMKAPSFTSHKIVPISVSPQQTAFSFDSAHRDDQLMMEGASSQSSGAAAPTKKTTTISSATKKKKVVKKVMPLASAAAADSAAVLAAVGAGIVPATIAMVMPMIAGKRKKRDLSARTAAIEGVAARNVTHFPDLDYEVTLQRILHKHVR